MEENVKKGTSEKIKELEDELKKTKYNKKTQHHIGLVKAKIASLKEKSAQRSKGKGKAEGFSVRRTGDATVIMVGFPSVGKSTLLNALTNAKSQVGHYAFTTLTVIPGLLEYKGSKIQILDVPGIVQGAASGRGRGKEVLSAAMNADLVLIILDIFQPKHLKVIQKEIYDTHLRLNQTRPDITITKKDRGGITIGKTVKLEMKDETIIGILKEFKISNASIVIRSPINEDQLIDVIEGNKKYVPAITLVNKMDLGNQEDIEKVKKEIHPDLFVSADKKTNIHSLKKLIFDRLHFIRAYCKEPGQKADLGIPLIMRKGNTIGDMCQKLHKDFVEKFKFARVWGKSAKFDGQKILKLTHEIKDKDTIELHMK